MIVRSRLRYRASNGQVVVKTLNGWLSSWIEKMRVQFGWSACMCLMDIKSGM